MSKTENIVNGIALFNAALPSIAKIVVTLSDGTELNLSDLVAETEEIVEQKLKEAEEHLARD